MLTTGRSGSTTFAQACRQLTTHTVGHESRATYWTGRLDYPDRHVEVDNRLTWMLGSLDARYGDDPVYVWLTRDPEQVARSYARRYDVGVGIMRAYACHIVMQPRPPWTEHARVRVARQMVQTINDNIRLFVRDKPRVVRVDIDDPHQAFDTFWDVLGGDGDRRAAHRTLGTVHNASRGAAG